MTVKMCDQLGRGENRIMSKPARDCARMPRLANALDGSMPDIAPDTGDYSYWQIAREKDRPLFNVEFNPGGNRGGVQKCFAFFDTGDIHAHVAHTFGERKAIIGRTTSKVESRKITKESI